MSEEIEAALMRAGQQIDQLQRECDVLRAERDHSRACVDNAVKILTSIHALLYPAPIKLDDGRAMLFRPLDHDPHNVLQVLSDRIRAIPDELQRVNQPHKPESQYS